MGFEWDDLYEEAKDELREELGREPFDYEVADAAQEKFEHLSCRAHEQSEGDR